MPLKRNQNGTQKRCAAVEEPNRRGKKPDVRGGAPGVFRVGWTRRGEKDKSSSKGGDWGQKMVSGTISCAYFRRGASVNGDEMTLQPGRKSRKGICRGGATFSHGTRGIRLRECSQNNVSRKRKRKGSEHRSRRRCDLQISMPRELFLSNAAFGTGKKKIKGELQREK